MNVSYSHFCHDNKDFVYNTDGSTGTMTTMDNKTGYPLLIFSVISAILTLPAFTNALIIYAIIVTQQLHNPSHILIANLAVADLGVALIAQPISLAVAFLEYLGFLEHVCLLSIPAVIVSILLGAGSLFTLTLISIDRYLAVRLHLQYRTLVTVKRVIIVIVLVWIGSAFCSVNILVVSYRVNASLNALTLVVLLVTIFVFYYKAYKRLRQQFTTVHPLNVTQRQKDINFIKYRKTLVTVLWVLFCVIICYAPYTGVIIKIASSDQVLYSSLAFAYYYSAMILHLSSSLNFVIILVRINPIRRTCVQLVRNICPHYQKQNCTVMH